jgi:hypothetical protein
MSIRTESSWGKTALLCDCLPEDPDFRSGERWITGLRRVRMAADGEWGSFLDGDGIRVRAPAVPR